MKKLIMIFLIINFFTFYVNANKKTDVPKDGFNQDLPLWYIEFIREVSDTVKDSTGQALPDWLKDWFVENQPKPVPKSELLYKPSVVFKHVPKKQLELKKQDVIKMVKFHHGIEISETLKLNLDELESSEYMVKNTTVTIPDWAKEIFNRNSTSSKKDSFNNFLPEWYVKND